MKHTLFPLDELECGAIRAVAIGRIKIVVIRTSQGDLHALRDRCPHRGGPLSRGLLQYRVEGDDVETLTLSDDCVLRCPWHGHEFDVQTGRCLADPTGMRVRAYEIGVEDGMVVVDR